jgi:hypothetical protein
MTQLIPVDHDPFAKQAQTFVPVDHDPFAAPAQAVPEKSWTQKALDTFTPGPDTLKNTMIGVGAGMYGLGKGAEQLALEGAGHVLPGSWGDAATKKAAEVGTERRQAISDFEPLRQSSTAANLGQMAGEALPMLAVPGIGEEGIAGGFLTKALGKAGGRAAGAALTGAGIGAVTNPDNPGAGALSGAAFGGATSAVASGAGKVLNAVFGDIADTRLGALSKKYLGGNTTLSEDLTGEMSKTDKLLANAPGIFGTKALREAKIQAANEGTKSRIADFLVNGAGSTAEDNDRYISAMYKDVRDMVDTVPEAQQTFTPKKTAAAANNLLGQFSDALKEFGDTRLENRIKRLALEVGTPAEGGSQVTFNDAWEMYKDLGSVRSAAETKLARGDFNRTAVTRLGELRTAIKKDMTQWASDIGKPEIMTKFDDSNSAFQTYRVKYGTLQKAYEESLVDRAGVQILDAKKMALKLEKMSAKNKAGFTSAEINENVGLASILKTVKDTSQSSNNVARWGLSSLGLGVEGAAAYKFAGGIPGVAKAAGVGAATASVAKFLTTTTAGKRLCMAASRFDPQGRAMSKLVDELMYNFAHKAVAAVGSEPVAEQQGFVEGGMINSDYDMEGYQKKYGAEALQKYFAEKEPGNVLHLPNLQGGYQESGVVDGPVKKTRGDNVLVPAHDGGEVPLETGEYITGVDAIMGKGHELMPQHRLSEEQAYAIGKQWYDAETTRLKKIMGNDTPPNNA